MFCAFIRSLSGTDKQRFLTLCVSTILNRALRCAVGRRLCRSRSPSIPGRSGCGPLCCLLLAFGRLDGRASVALSRCSRLALARSVSGLLGSPGHRAACPGFRTPGWLPASGLANRVALTGTGSALHPFPVVVSFILQCSSNRLIQGFLSH